jgi:hypothetical protein
VLQPIESGGFRDWKRIIHNNRKNGVVPVNTPVADGISKAFDQLALNFPEVRVTNHWKKEVTGAILDITYATQECITPQKEREAFEIMGSHREIRPDENPATTSSVEFFRMMAKCYSDIPKHLLDAMYEQRDVFADILRRDGRFRMEQFIQHQFPQSTTTKDKTDAGEGRGWATIISNSEILASHERKRLESTPEFKEARRIEAQQAKQQQRDIDNARKVIDKRRKEEERKQEREKAVLEFKQLPKVVQDEIKQQKREGAALKKSRKLSQDDREYEEARRLIGDEGSQGNNYGTVI